jgi:hypothetical protein
MDRTHLVRLRWRLSGAWLWPMLLVLSVVDAAVVHGLPPAGDSEGAVGAWLLSSALMLIAVVIARPVLGPALRRVRRDLPRTVARNYAGTLGALGVSIALATGGIVHHPAILQDRAAKIEAHNRAEAWLGDHAPSQFMANVPNYLDTVPIQPPDIYRTCVANTTFTRFWCVTENVTRPFGSGVHFSGTESNFMLEQGTQ